MQDVSSTPRFTIFGTFREAWHLTKGTKGTIWGISFILFLIAVVFLFAPTLIAMLTHAIPITSEPQPFFSTASSLGHLIIAICYVVGMVIIIPGAFAALGKIVIERARGNPISVKMGLRAFWRRLLPVLFTFIIAYALILIPALIAVLVVKITPNVLWLVLFVAYALIVGTCMSLSLFMAVDKTNNPFAAAYRSFKATWPHFYRVMGLIIVNELIGLCMQLPAQIGGAIHSETLSIIGFAFMAIVMIWVIPFQLLAFGVMYRKLVD